MVVLFLPQPKVCESATPASRSMVGVVRICRRDGQGILADAEVVLVAATVSDLRGHCADPVVDLGRMGKRDHVSTATNDGV